MGEDLSYILAYIFVTLWGTCLIFATSGCESPRPEEAKTPSSVLLIIVDTLRADHLASYGYSKTTSPKLDALAAESLLFEQVASPAPFTVPAVAGLMTGNYPNRLGVINHSRSSRLKEEIDTLAEAAAASGYATAAVVSNPWLASKVMGFDQGFQTFRTKRDIGIKRGRFSADAVTDSALDWLESVSPERPFFLWTHYIDAHMPYSSKSWSEVDHSSDETPALLKRFVEQSQDRQDIFYGDAHAPDDITAVVEEYDRAISFIDHEIGRLIGGAQRQRGSDNLIVIVTADHGESLGDHGLYFAHDFTLYDELVHVPLLIRIPGVPGGRHSALVSLIDIHATVCHLLELDCPSSTDAVPLPITDATTGDSEAERQVFAQNAPWRARYGKSPWHHMAGPQGRSAMIRWNGNKLLRTPTTQGLHWEAFNLTNDPEEKTDIYDPKDYAAHERALEMWLASEPSALSESVEPSDTGAAQSNSKKQQRLGRETRRELKELGYLD